jgi:general stress protein YciG
MATNNSDNNTSNRGLGSDNMSEQKKHEIQSKGGKASAKSSNGAAGSTEAARRGGENSSSNGNSK